MGARGGAPSAARLALVRRSRGTSRRRSSDARPAPSSSARNRRRAREGFRTPWGTPRACTHARCPYYHPHPLLPCPATTRGPATCMGARTRMGMGAPSTGPRVAAPCVGRRVRAACPRPDAFRLVLRARLESGARLLPSSAAERAERAPGPFPHVRHRASRSFPFSPRFLESSAPRELRRSRGHRTRPSRELRGECSDRLSREHERGVSVTCANS